MKKLLAILLAGLLVASFAACRKGANDAQSVESTASGEEMAEDGYQDGEYSVKYAVPALDRTVDYLKVKVEDGQLTIADYGMREMEAGMEETSSVPLITNNPTLDTPGNESAPAAEDALTEHEKSAAEYAEMIIQSYEAAEKNVDEMVPVDGGEEHFYRFIRMMREAQKMAKSGEGSALEVGRYADGYYEAVMPSPNADGWTEYVHVTVKDGEISKIDYDAMKGTDSGTLITADEKLNKESPKPSEYYPGVVENFELAGYEFTQMLTPPGGIEATKTFRKLMQPLLLNMVSGGETDVIGSRYIDGTYRAEFKDFDEFGWKYYTVVRIYGGKVNVLEFDAVSELDEKQLRTKQGDLEQEMENKTGMNASEAVYQLGVALEKGGDDITEVDNIAGATITSNTYKLLVGQILTSTALEGDFGTLEVDPVDAKKES